MSSPTDDTAEHNNVIRLTIPPRYIALIGGGITVGACLGITRGARKSSLRFLAENAHRPPRTVRGWYLYNKTKNYRVMLGAIKMGSWEASRLGLTMLGWVGIEEGLERAGYGDIKEIGAGAGTASVFALVSRLPMRTSRRAILLGLGVGLTMSGLRWIQERLRLSQSEGAGGGDGGGTDTLKSEALLQ